MDLEHPLLERGDLLCLENAVSERVRLSRDPEPVAFPATRQGCDIRRLAHNICRRSEEDTRTAGAHERPHRLVGVSASTLR
jgi:hypothetical protein